MGRVDAVVGGWQEMIKSEREEGTKSDSAIVLWEGRGICSECDGARCWVLSRGWPDLTFLGTAAVFVLILKEGKVGAGRPARSLLQ